MTNKHNQQGFSLFMVMIMMIVIALLVVITSQTTSTESRLSANEADRKYALSEAEVGLREGEKTLNEIYNEILKLESSSGATASAGAQYKFTVACKGSANKERGMCAPVEKVDWIRADDRKHFDIEDKDNGVADKAAWERDKIFEASNNSSIASSNGKARYIIEYMGQREDSASIHDYFRVTARAQGENQNTVVTLQSYVEMTRSY